jgi:hypothetical protein
MKELYMTHESCNNDSPFSLEQIEIASPCSADWNEMTGSDQVRFCGSCQLNVYNLSAMTRQQAETLFQEKEGRLCVRLYKRQDGTVITQDCPVGLKIRHQKVIAAQHAKRLKLGRNIAAAAVALFAVAGIYTTIITPQDVFAEGKQDIRKQDLKGRTEVRSGEAELKGEAVAPHISRQGQTMGDVTTPPHNGTAITGSPPPMHPPKGYTPKDDSQVEVGKPAQQPTNYKMGKPAYHPPNKPNKEILKPCGTKKNKDKPSIQGNSKPDNTKAPILGRIPVKKD